MKFFKDKKNKEYEKSEDLKITADSNFKSLDDKEILDSDNLNRFEHVELEKDKSTINENDTYLVNSQLSNDHLHDELEENNKDAKVKSSYKNEEELANENVLDDNHQFDNLNNTVIEDLQQQELNKIVYLLLPSNFVIGYYEGMSAKQLREYINGYVYKYFNAPNITSYKITKFNAGYIFEIHDGDPKTSYLKVVLDSFNDGKNIVFVKTQNRVAKIVKNYSKIDTYLLPEADTSKYPDALLPEKGKMKPIMNTGFGMVSFGLAIAFMGVTSLFLSSIFKTILGRDEIVTIEKQIIELPSTYIEKIPAATETKYISKVFYENGKWTMKEKEFKTRDMIILEENNTIVSKIIPYKTFVEKCYNKTKSFEQCADDNPFFDNINLTQYSRLKDVTVKSGIIKIDFTNGDFINYLPTINNLNLKWNYECSKSGIANVCSTAESLIIGSKDKSIVKDLFNETNKLEVSKDADKTGQPLIKDVKIIENIIQDPLKKEKQILPLKKDDTKSVIKKSPETKEITKDTKVLPPSHIPSTLNLNNIPDDIITE